MCFVSPSPTAKQAAAAALCARAQLERHSARAQLVCKLGQVKKQAKMEARKDWYVSVMIRCSLDVKRSGGRYKILGVHREASEHDITRWAHRRRTLD